MEKREFIFFALLALCLVEHVQAACQMVEIQNKNIGDGDLAVDTLPSSPTAQGCYDNCLAESTCTYARYESTFEFCSYSTSANPTLLDEGGSIIAKKECVAETTTTASTTTMTTSTTTSTTTTPTTTTTTPTTTTTTPTTTTTTPTTTITTAATTTTTPTTTTTTPTTTTTTPATTTKKDYAGRMRVKAPAWKTPTDGSSWSRRVDTLLPGIATLRFDECLMSLSTTMVGAGTATRIDMSSSASCFDGCKYARRCSHAEYVPGTGTGTCNFYSSSNKFQGSTDVNSWKKDTCFTGNSGSCCFDLNLTTNDGKTPVLSMTSSLNSCKDVCLKWANCAAVSFTSPICTIYTEAKTHTSTSTLYVKDCTDWSSSSEVIDLQCQTGSSLKPVHFLIITSTVGVFIWPYSGR